MWAVVVPTNEVAAQWRDWGQESLLALLKPLLSDPRLEFNMDRA